MKKSILTKLLAVMMCCLMLLGMLAGCKDDGSQDTLASGDSTEATAPEYYGMLMINAGGAVYVTYDENGLVTNIEGIDQSGIEIATEYQDYLGTDCATAVCTLVDTAIGMGYLDKENNDIIIKQEKGSQNPEEDFLDKIVTAVQAEIDPTGLNVSIILISTGDLNSSGYIGLGKVQELVTCHLNVTKLDLFDGTDSPIDGTYSFEVAAGNIEDHYLIDAVTGEVYEGFLEGYDFMDEDYGMDDIPQEYYDMTLATQATTEATQAVEDTTAAAQETTAATEAAETSTAAEPAA